MNYELRYFDTPLLVFSATEDTNIPEINILWVNEEKKNFLPLNLQPTADGLWKWLKNRTIPQNRAYVHNFLSKCGLSINRPMNIIKVSKGLSLNDCYWIVEENFSGSFAQYNLYDNRFSKILAMIAFTGYGSNIRSSLASCPEFTTNGALPKCWRRQNGKILLYKGGTSGASNSGNEPYSEYYTAQIAEILGINCVKYNLSKWQGELCSTCELFTSKNFSFIPAGRIVAAGGMPAVIEFYTHLGDNYLKALNDMFVLDAIICNTDRHLSNFGFLIDNKTNKIAAPAPLFDHGNALFNFAGRDDLENEQALTKYAATLWPCTYDDFIGTAQKVLTSEQRRGLRQLLNFRFKRHTRYNLSAERLNLLEKQVQARAAQLL